MADDEATDLLRRAAEHLNGLRRKATGSPWFQFHYQDDPGDAVPTPSGDLIANSEPEAIEDGADPMQDIGSMVRKADAALVAPLRSVADVLPEVLLDLADLVEMGHFADPVRVERFTALARAVLGETHDSTPSGPFTAADLIAEADRVREQSNALGDLYLDLRRRALAAMPDGTRLGWYHGRGDAYVRRGRYWWCPGDLDPDSTVKEYWLRGSLVVIPEEADRG